MMNSPSTVLQLKIEEEKMEKIRFCFSLSVSIFLVLLTHFLQMLPLGVNSIELSHIFLVRQEEKTREKKTKKKAFSSLMRRCSSTDVRVFSLLGPMELEENEEKKAKERREECRKREREKKKQAQH